MADEQPPGDQFLDGNLLPFDEDAAGDDVINQNVTPEEFLFIGEALTADQFTAYVRDYDFGPFPHDFVVLHHTANPSTQHARYSSGLVWDAGEAGLTESQIKQKRLRSLTGIKEFYRRDRGWDRGPHLFVDERWIWLFTPMFHTGIHAVGANYYRDAAGFHYSIAIEVVGYYERVRWPDPVANLVGHVVAVLRQRLGTFDLRHQPRAGAVSSHRDYNKPQCPGAAITEGYYLGVLQRGWERFTTVTAIRDLSASSPILGPPSGTQQQAVDYVQAQLSPSSEYAADVATIMGYYWRYAPGVGVDPFLAAAQCIYETEALRSWWARRPRRNPANLGVRSRVIGLSFATWEDAVQAHLGQLLAFAVPQATATEAQLEMMRRNPGHILIAPTARGAAPTLRDLNDRWDDIPDYAYRLLAVARAIRGS